MMSAKKIVSAILHRFLPLKFYKLVANGFTIVPAYYRDIISETERFMDLASEDSDMRTLLLMRKYGHIIDKGLHRKDATPGHSISIYKELKHSVQRLKNSQFANDPTVAWAEEKIKTYEKLQSNPAAFSHLAAKSEVPALDFNQLYALIRQRRSNRNFSEKPVEDSTLKLLASTANWASSSCNKQPIEVFFTTDPHFAAECLKCCKGGTGFSHNIPAFVVFTANIRGYVYPTEMCLPYIDTSLGAQNFFLAATTLGLSGTILSWAQKSSDEESRLRTLLNIPTDCQIIFCAAMGYALDEFQPPVRKF